MRRLCLANLNFNSTSFLYNVDFHSRLKLKNVFLLTVRKPAVLNHNIVLFNILIYYYGFKFRFLVLHLVLISFSLDYSIYVPTTCNGDYFITLEKYMQCNFQCCACYVRSIPFLSMYGWKWLYLEEF